MDNFQWLCLHFPRVPWWEHAPLLSVVIGFVTSPFSAALSSGIVPFSPAGTSWGTPLQINYLLSNPYLRSASEKTPTCSKKTLFGFYRTTSHFFTFVASAEKALGKAGVLGSTHTHPAGPEPQSQFLCFWRSIPLFLKTSGLGPVLWMVKRWGHTVKRWTSSLPASPSPVRYVPYQCPYWPPASLENIWVWLLSLPLMRAHSRSNTQWSDCVSVYIQTIRTERMG